MLARPASLQRIIDILGWLLHFAGLSICYLFPTQQKSIQMARHLQVAWFIMPPLHLIWIFAITCKLCPVLCILKKGIFTTLTKIYYSALWRQQKDWFIQVCTAHSAAVRFQIICLENPSELKRNFQNKLLSFSSAAWLHTPWKVQRFFCINISLNFSYPQFGK